MNGGADASITRYRLPMAARLMLRLRALTAEVAKFGRNRALVRLAVMFRLVAVWVLAAFLGRWKKRHRSCRGQAADARDMELEKPHDVNE